MSSVIDATRNILFAIGGTIFSIIVDFVLVLVVGFLWLVSSDRLKAFTVDLFPEAHHELIVDIFREMGFRMGGFLRAVAINSLAVGLVVGVACWLLRLPDPVILGIFAGLTAAIPMVGGIIGVVPAVLLGFTISPEYPILVLAVLLVIQLVDANTVVPMVMNRVVSLPALGVVLALLVGGAIQGLDRRAPRRSGGGGAPGAPGARGRPGDPPCAGSHRPGVREGLRAAVSQPQGLGPADRRPARQSALSVRAGCCRACAVASATCLLRAMRSAAISAPRVWRGSITSSM